ncbi:calcium-binding protein [Streptomyces sp. NPDC059063]|uniref:calcium-binding protein n=1 Tax=unclassified Streptomyces TaxID=2593676 RepID=UPI0036927A5F
MRIRATLAAVSGALALSAFAVPAAQADDAAGETQITDVTVNGGKDIVVGTSVKKKVTIELTATNPTGISKAKAMLWHGTDFSRTGIDGSMVPSTPYGDCTAADETTSTCTFTVYADPADTVYRNALAGKWKVWAAAYDKDEVRTVEEAYKTVNVQRAAKLTVNASPEPVKKGKAITVAGALTRANWDTHKYAGYTRQPVKLEFKKKGASAWSTVKTVTSDGKGNLRTTVKASADGTFRYVFAGTSTTPAVTSAGDAIDVR